ncbi:caspase family protein [Dyadobacter psychrotolerans]|uniref:Caspase family protein n=1 Tax=Dyadobacter psychrotolerans TaxID=2541721 RepID=A0A4R5DT65_9BACT|nr:caspase family protein [Dyadobacter psychrotolerans]TDE15574.1 caspase family protein [Dyadobacter psychrotolerans]
MANYKKPFCRRLKCGVSVSAALGLFVILLLPAAARSYGQSYFYFENKLSVSGTSPVTYYTFLTLQNNGTAVARIRYLDPSSGNPKLVEINLLDSADTDNGAGSREQFLIPDGEPLPIEGIDANGFRLPRFIFKKETEGQDSFFIPQAVVYKLPDGSWHSSEMLDNQQKSNTELKEQSDLVRIFFNETDEFYQYLFALRRYYRAPVKRKEKIYLIVVANTLADKIGVTTKTDMSNVVATFSQLAQDLNMDIQTQKIMDNDFGKLAVELAVANLRPSPIDIVVFYYSGHGFRYSNDPGDYPRISLRIGTEADIDKNNISLEYIYKRLLKKKAKVTLVISDCCNDDIGAAAPSGPGLIITRTSPGQMKPALNMTVCNRLFFPANPTSILIGSAEKNQLAAGSPSVGGYFTSVFSTDLRRALYTPGKNVTWVGLLAGSRKQASWESLKAECGPKKNRCVQSAVFRVIQ